MKKKIAERVLAVATAVLLVCGIGTETHADGQQLSKAVEVYDAQIVPEDPVDLFIETLDTNLQAGTYMDGNGEFVLAVTDVDAAQQIIGQANLPAEIKLVEVGHSLAELEAARDDLFEKAKEYDIQIVAIDASVNGLAVFTANTSEYNQNNILNHVAKYAESTNDDITSKSDVAASNGIHVLIYDNSVRDTTDIDETTIEHGSSVHWFDDVKKERQIDDFSRFNAALSALTRQIEGLLDDAQYSGIDEITISFTDKQTNETSTISIGLMINYVDLEKVKPVVEECLKQYDSFEGIIDINYNKCKYSLIDLRRIEKKVQAQPFSDSLYNQMISGGKLHITQNKGCNDLDSFISDKSYKDAIVIHAEPDKPNPLA